ncbi:hypothetical protein SCG7086_AB_00460 [Chlamydiales bacterium SCGC AG-110-P3]|nr:hypothetical protein SCG7086_AB_00460 [Chlamydiales bacterium SCGC AG-110-P3]
MLILKQYGATIMHPVEAPHPSLDPSSSSPLPQAGPDSLNLENIPSQAFTKPTTDLFSRIIRWYNGTYPLKSAIENLYARHRNLTEDSRPQFIKDLIEVISIFSQHKSDPEYWSVAHKLTFLIRELDEESLNHFFDATANEHRKECNHKETGKCLETVLSLTPLPCIHRAILKKYGHNITNNPFNLGRLKQMATETSECQPRNKVNWLNSEIQEATEGVLRSCSNFFQSFTTAFFKAHNFSLSDEAPFDRTEANDRLTNIYQLIEKPLKVAELILGAAAIVSPTNWLPILITAVVIATIFISLSLLHKYHQKNIPIQLSNGFKNLTAQAQKGEFSPLIGRGEVIQGLVRQLSPENNGIKCPLLIGLPGVGKTAIIKRLAQEIADEKHTSLKDRQIYHIDTANLLPTGVRRAGHTFTRLEVLLQEIKGREGNVILFFDKIHSILNSKNGSGSSKGSSEQLQALLANPKIRCIAATTKEGHEETIQNQEISNCFRNFVIKPLETANCNLLLRNLVHHSYPDVTISSEAIKRALEITDDIDPEFAQPEKAEKLIHEAVSTLRLHEDKKTSRLQRLRDDYNHANNCILHTTNVSQYAPDMQDRHVELTSKRDEIAKIEAEINENKREIRKLEQLEFDYRAWHQRFVNLAHDIRDLPDDSKKTIELGKKYLFIGDYMLKSIQQEKDKQETRLNNDLGITTKVNEDLIVQVFQNRQQDGAVPPVQTTQSVSIQTQTDSGSSTQPMASTGTQS